MSELQALIRKHIGEYDTWISRLERDVSRNESLLGLPRIDFLPDRLQSATELRAKYQQILAILESEESRTAVAS